jgi:hypothetical protein
LPVDDRSYRDRNQRNVIVEQALQHSLGREKNLAVDLSQRPDAFSPLPLNAAKKTPWVYGIH